MKRVTMIMTTILVSLATTTFAQQKDASQNKTKGYIVFAMGFNSVSNSSKEIYDNLDMGKSHFYEIGYARNTRLSDKSNLLHLNYGLSFVYNNLRIKNGYEFKQDATEVLTEHSTEVSKTKFRNSYLQIPVYLEFDLTSDQRLSNPNKISKKGFKIGVGGFMGFKLKTKQKLEYNNGKEETYKNFETNKFTYGIGTYIGYNWASLYVKYDIQEMFKYNATDNPHNVSFGLRIDL